MIIYNGEERAIRPREITVKDFIKKFAPSHSIDHVTFVGRLGVTRGVFLATWAGIVCLVDFNDKDTNRFYGEDCISQHSLIRDWEICDFEIKKVVADD